MSKYIALIAVCLVSAAIALQAQNTLPTEQVEIVKNFDARLLETDRIGLQPELPPLDTSVKRQAYNISGRPINVEYPAPQIRPLAMRGERVPKVYNGYTRLGAGMPSSLLGEFSYNIAKDKKYNFGIGAQHHSANNTGKVENQRFSYTSAGVDGTYYLEQGIAINGKARYTADNVFFYGYNNLNDPDNPAISFDKEDIRQRFSMIDVGANVFNGERTVADFNYQAGFDFYYLQDSYAARENGFDLKINATKWIQERHAFRINLRTDFTSYRDTAKQSLHNFYLQPNFTFSGDAFRAKVGLNLVSHDDEFSFFPDIELSARVIGPVLNVFAGAEGSLQKNTFRSLSEYNPFISSRIRLRNTRYIDYFGGIRGVVQGVDYRVQAGYKTTDHLATFLWNGDSLPPRFNVLYDTIDVAYVTASLVAPLFKGFEINGKFTQNFFSAGKEGKAWHLPATTISAGARYATTDGKASVRADLFLENGVPYLDTDGVAKNLNALFDLSLGADYRLTDNIGVFLQLNNLANNRRQRWQHYPVFGLNALAGITARF